MKASVRHCLEERTPLRARRAGVIGLGLSLGVLFFGSLSAKADVDMQPADFTIRSSADFKDMVFVLYSGGGAARIYPQRFPPSGGGYGPFFVLAVPKALAETNKGGVDPAWRQGTTPGVIPLGMLRCPHVYGRLVLDYQAVKTENGATLKLLNPEALKAAQQSPGSDPSLRRARAESKSDAPRSRWLYWGLGAAGILLLAGGGAWYFRHTRRPGGPV